MHLDDTSLVQNDSIGLLSGPPKTTRLLQRNTPLWRSRCLVRFWALKNYLARFREKYCGFVACECGGAVAHGGAGGSVVS